MAGPKDHELEPSPYTKHIRAQSLYKAYYDSDVKSLSTGGEIRLLSRGEVVEERRQLTRLIDGDAFFPLKSWPKEIRLIFWKKPAIVFFFQKRSSWFSFSSVTVVSQALLEDGECWRRHWAESTTKAE